MGSGIKITHDEFIRKLNNIQPDLTLIGSYVNMKNRIRVKDKDGIIYILRPQDLLLGKKPTIQSAENRNLAFEIKAKLIHGDLYDYSKINYKNARTKILVSCKIHGEFYANPDCHLNSKSGCHTCGKLSSENKRKHDGVGWKLWKWQERGDKSKQFESFKLYILECWNGEEKFIKIGRTFVKIKKRFEDKNKMPYKWKVISTITGTAYYIFKLEHKLHKTFKEFRYKPNLIFGGMRECFDINIQNEFTPEFIDNLFKEKN